MNKNKQTSFTLIELLVVIVIIGILAGVIMISTSSSIDKASVAKLKVFEESVSNNLADSMVSRWKLDGNVNDFWGGNNGTNHNVTFPNESQCISGQCGSFNGSTAYIDCGNNAELNFGNRNFTITAWIKTTGTNYMVILGKGSGNAAYNQGR
ncbi:MAG: type II secretion system protein [Bacilli bacterium]